MTSEEARNLGYKLVPASSFEVGLLKDRETIRTWFVHDFNGEWPSMEHPKIQNAIQINEQNQHD